MSSFNRTIAVEGNDKSVFVTDLFWQVLTSNKKDIEKKDFNDEAESLKSNAAVFRKGAIPQLGYFNKSITDSYSGYYSLACALVDAISSRVGSEDVSFLFAAKLDGDSFYYVACKNGVVLPDGDFTGSEAEVEERLNDDLDQGNWSIIYAPTSFSIGDSSSVEIEQLVPLNKKSLKRQYKATLFLKTGEKNNSKVLFLSFSIIFLLIAFFGYKYWLKLEEEKEMQAILDRAALNNTNIEYQEVLPWVTQLDPVLFVNACYDALASYPLSPAGWSLNQVICNPTNMQINWERGNQGGTPLDFISAVPDGTVGVDGLSSNVVSAFTDVSVKDSDTLKDASTVINKINSDAYLAGLNFNFALVPPPVLPPNPDGTMPPPPSFSAYSWSVVTQINPVDLISYFNVDGFRVKSISMSLEQSTPLWRIEGVQYVN
jgi:hypothetical protein